MQPLVVVRMPEGKMGGVEQQPLVWRSGPIETITDNGTTEPLGVAGMEPQLMGATGERLEGHQGPLAIGCDLAPLADPYFTVDRVIDLMGPIVGIKAKREDNLAS